MMVEFDGHPIHVEREGSGEPIVFLHNAGTCGAVWRPQVEHFRATNEVVALDMLGFGRSAKPHVEYTLPLYARMLEAVLDGLGLGRVALVGNCIGSAAALRFASLHPGRVRRLVLLNLETDFALAHGDYQPAFALTSLGPRGRWLLAAAGARVPVPRRLLEWGATRQFHGDLDPDMRRLLATLYHDRDNLRVLTNVLSNMPTFTLPADRAGLPPSCLIWGRENNVLPHRHAARIAHAIDAAEVHVLDDAAHLTALEHPARVNAIIERFLSPAT